MSFGVNNPSKIFDSLNRKIKYSQKGIQSINMKLQNLTRYNKSKPFDIKDETPPRDENGITIRDVSFSNTIEGRVSAYLVIPSGTGPFPAIHFIHWLETHADDSNRTQFLPHAIELAKQGYLSILPDAFWSTTPSKFEENPVLWWKTEVEYDTELCRKQIVNLLRTHDVLFQRDDVNQDRIALVAHDFGAMFGSLLATFNKNYKTFVFMAATGRFSDWFKFGSKFSPEEMKPYIESMSFLDPVTNISNIKDKKILFQFADDDFYVPRDKALELYDAAGEPKEIRWYNAKHSMNESTFVEMKTWVKDQL
ncbi:MAG: alpha/beta hydrolase [Candidatus Heimdallarchaeota archaeon]|nr:alpha/beta hydrolase [Candidatus Heimdallarchaeota archaeon]